MSAATKKVLARVRRMIPPMLETFHKGSLLPEASPDHDDSLIPTRQLTVPSPQTGQLGRVAVIGGSEDYTGAPYFSAMASARLGCDMVCLLPSSTPPP